MPESAEQKPASSESSEPQEMLDIRSLKEMKKTTAITRVQGLAYGFLAGVPIGIVAAVVFLFAADSVVTKAGFWTIAVLVALLCGAVGLVFPRTVKIVATVISMVPIP